MALLGACLCFAFRQHASGGDACWRDGKPSPRAAHACWTVMDLEGRACSARSERAVCDAAGTWHPVLGQSFLYANKPVLAPKASAAPPLPAMPAPFNQDARAVWALRGAAWRLVVLWRVHPCEMAQKAKCLSVLCKPPESRYERPSKSPRPFDSPHYPSLHPSDCACCQAEHLRGPFSAR